VLTDLKWIKKGLTEEGEIEDVKKQKFDFTRNDYKDLVASMWTRDCPVFIHGLLKVFMLFALQVFLFTGARIGAFIPEDKHKELRGLRFKVRFSTQYLSLPKHTFLTVRSILNWSYSAAPIQTNLGR
jgi:hypothetical protein